MALKSPYFFIFFKLMDWKNYSRTQFDEDNSYKSDKKKKKYTNIAAV